MGIQQMLIGQSGVAGTTLDALILAKSPIAYWRHAEASGSTMTDSSGNARNGSYSTTPAPIPKTAIYTGGPTCMQATSNTSYGFYTGTPPALNQMTVNFIYQPGSITSVRSLVTRDSGGGGGRKFQIRMNAAKLEFVRIVGSVATYSSTSTTVFAIGTTCMVSVTVDASGNVLLYRNGILLTGSFTGGSAAAGNYGGSGDNTEVGYSTGVGTAANGYFSETAIFDTVLTAGDLVTFATAAGL